jgi:hypothetical protein
MRSKRLWIFIVIACFMVQAVYAGVAGFTYNISFAGNSQYNIWGQSTSNVYATQYQFQTYSVHISGVLRFFDQLVVRGRVWQAQELYPGSPRICTKTGDTYSVYSGYAGCSGCTQTPVLSLSYPIVSYGPHYATGRHRLVQQGATNTQGNPPSNFYTRSDANGSFPQSHFTRGAGLACVSP